MKEQGLFHVPKKRKRPAPSSSPSSILCPWWNTRINHEGNDFSYQQCNIYGLYQYILSHHDTDNNIDLSFWPMNDCDMQQLMKMMVETPSLRAESAGNTTIGTSTTRNKSDGTHLVGIQSLTFHFCSYLTDCGIDCLATYWKDRGSGRIDFFKKNQNNNDSGDDRSKHNGENKVNEFKETDKYIQGNSHRPINTPMTINYGRFNPPLLYLDLSNCSNLTNAACKAIGTYFTKLQMLNLSYCIKITDTGLRRIMNGCKYIHEIHLRNLQLLQDEGLGFLRRNLVLMKLLRIIDIAGCIGFTNEAIIHLLESDPSPGVIHQIDLSDCTQIELGAIGLKRNSVSTNVKTMKLRNIPRVSDSMMGWVASGCKYLQNIDLTGSVIASDISLGYLFSGCKRLKSLCLNRCKNITDKALEGIDDEIGKRLQELELVDCEEVGHTSIVSIVQRCPYLTKLNLKGVTHICSNTILAIATYCTHLEHLDLSTQIISSSTSTDSHFSRVGADAIKALGKYCPKLRILRCVGCTRLDDDSIIELARGCHQLEELSFKWCYRLTDGAIKAIGENCPSMLRIYVSSCREISDNGIIYLSRGCPKLEVVDFMNVTELTDNSVLNIAMNCPNLRYVNLQNCYKLSNKSLLGLAHFCQHLEEINMVAVDNLSDTAIEDLNTFCPSIRSLNVGGSEISDEILQNISKALYYCKKREGKLLLEPLHRSGKIHQQHKKFMTFILKHQKVLYCAFKTQLYQKRLHQRQNILQKCLTIQNAFRNYRSRLLLNTASKIMKQEREGRLIIKKSSNIIIAFFRMIRLQRVNNNASIRIQKFMRKVLVRKKEKEKRRKTLLNVVEAFVESEKIEKQETPTSKVDEPSESSTSKWEALVSQSLKKQEHYLASRFLQQWWRQKTRETEAKRLEHIAQKVKKWIHSFVLCHKYLRIVKVWVTFRIQIYFRCRCRWNAMAQSLLKEERYRRERIKAAQKIAFNFQVHWRRRNGKKIHASLKMMRLERLGASVKIQSWWRRLLCLSLYRYKYKITHRWKVLIQGKCLKMKNGAATLIQERFRFLRQKNARLHAFRTILFLLPILIRKKKQRKRLLLEKQTNSITCIQKITRGFVVRSSICRQRLASKQIQRMWRMFLCRRFYRNLCIQESRRIRDEEIKKKEELIEQRRLKLIDRLFEKTEVRAARIIQSRFRNYIAIIKEEEKERIRKDEEARKSRQEEERRKMFQSHRRQKRNVKVATKKYLENALSMISNVRANEVFGEVKNKLIRSSEKNVTDKNKLFPELMKASYLKNQGELYSSEIIQSFYSSILETLGSYEWFDERCEQIMFSYALCPEDISHLRRIWQESLDFRCEEKVSIHAFFDHIEEKKSIYGTWLFSAVNISPENYINFSEYIHVVSYFSILGKIDLMKMVFKLKCKGNNAHLLKEDWSSLIDLLLVNENIQYSKAGAIAAFDKFASFDVHKNRLLFFSDFRKIVNQFPFIIAPMLRLQTKVRKHHIGEKFWIKQAHNLQMAAMMCKKEESVRI